MTMIVTDSNAACLHDTMPDSPVNWRRRAKCRGVDPDLFFPFHGASAAPAKALCSRCPVRSDCLTFAIDNHLQDGVFGGMSPRERRREAARRRGLGLVLTCEWCRESFSAANTRTRYCTLWCRNQAKAQRRSS